MQAMKIKFEWEVLDFKTGKSASYIQITARSKVIGGWIVRDRLYEKSVPIQSMVFVRDPMHVWEIEED
jgi:hypothetical protein